MSERDPDATRLHDEDKTRIRPHDDEAAAAEATNEPGHIESGHYSIIEKLGQGAFSEVFLAEDERDRRRVALKWLRPGVAADDKLVHRFRSVAERTEALHHPNIITVLGYEMVEDRPAIIMEYVPGQSLRQMLRKGGSLPVDETLEIASQLCEALIYAHDNGFIHRDVKPDNVLIMPSGVVKLGDFDIAKVTSSPSFKTRVGARIGTAYYMSPEQLRGQTDVDERSDVFSMGTVLYEMLTGEVPVGRFEHPSEGRPDLPRRLGSVILKALARDRGARYDSIKDLRDALTGIPETRQAQSIPFDFRGARQPAKTIDELVELCEKDWQSARWHLTEGHFPEWLEVTNPELAPPAAELLQQEPDEDLALERLLHLLDPTLPDPVLAVEPEVEIALGDLAAKERVQRVIKVSNPSRGYLVGAASAEDTWLEVNPSEFRLREGENLAVTLSATALEDLGKHTSHIILDSNGGRVSVPVAYTTAKRLYFPRAGLSAGDIPQMIELCRNNRAEAIELFYDGSIENWLRHSMMRYNLVARAQELTYRYGESQTAREKEKGLRAFLLTCDPKIRHSKLQPFRFRNNKTAASIPELVDLCEIHWDDAIWHLYEGHFAIWLKSVDPLLVSDVERISEKEKNRDMGLEEFLHLLDPELPLPQLEISPQEIDLGSAAPGEHKRFPITIRNAGRGYLFAQFPTLDRRELARRWLILGAAFGFVQKSGGWLLLRPNVGPGHSDAKEIGLAKSFDMAIKELASKPDLYEHLSALVRDKVNGIGQEQATRILKQHVEEYLPTSHRESVLSDLEAMLLQSEENWVYCEYGEYSFGCLAGKSHELECEARIPSGTGRHLLTLPVSSTGGQEEISVHVQVANRLLFPAANVSASSLEELAKVSARHWNEARSLWGTGAIRTWLDQGLMRFDLAGKAGQLAGSELSAGRQLAQFLTLTYPKCQEWLPPFLKVDVDEIDLGTALGQTEPYVLRIENTGGGDITGLRVRAAPKWLTSSKRDAEPSSVTFTLQGHTQTVKNSGLIKDTIVFVLVHPPNTARAPTYLSLPVKMEIEPSVRIGRWRIRKPAVLARRSARPRKS